MVSYESSSIYGVCSEDANRRRRFTGITGSVYGVFRKNASGMHILTEVKLHSLPLLRYKGKRVRMENKDDARDREVLHSIWPPVGSESLSWQRDVDELSFIPKSRRRAITSTYDAAVPAYIGDLSPELSRHLLMRVADLAGDLARFDALQEHRGFDLPALLLRSESAASSQIENLTSSVRNVALAELAADAPHNAQLIAGNVAAMRAALTLPGKTSVESILEMHRTLINRAGNTFGGEIRNEQVWVGGTPYSPHGALYVPPSASRVRPLLDDLVSFAVRDDIQPLAKATVVHAQFETIHPFIDGNGRTGRVLLHKMLRDDGVLRRTTLPVSAGLLHDVDGYMRAIAAYQSGDLAPVLEQVLDALEISLALGGTVAARFDGVIEAWREIMTERAGSSIRKLPSVLVEQPVVNVPYVANKLGVSERAARTVVERACEYGMLQPMGNRRRGVFYQADRLIEILEEISSAQGIRRVLSGGIR